MTTERRKLRDRLLNGILRGLIQFFRLTGWRTAQAIGASIGWAGWLVAGRERRRILEHLAIAFPELPLTQRKRLGRRSLRHQGTSLGECLYLLTRDCTAVNDRVRVEGWETVERLREHRRPLLILTGHCGNWELLAAAINCRGLDMRVVARELDEEGFQSLLLALRSRFGTETITRGSPGAARALLTVLRDGGALGMLIDQDTRVDGVWVPFFGHPAYTPVAAAELARRHDTAVIPAFIERRPDGSHLARFQEPLDLPDAVEDATALMHACIEAQIRRVPAQWVWMHRRWRRHPNPES